eukprot:4863648-Pyramimonas_sp.AAC.1
MRSTGIRGCDIHLMTLPNRLSESLHTARSIAALLSSRFPEVPSSRVSKIPFAPTKQEVPGGMR